MTQQLVGFLTIFGACLAGYANLGPWAIAIATLGLLALSYQERQGLFRRATELGLHDAAETTLLGSLFNALCATSAAYGFGLLLRII